MTGPTARAKSCGSCTLCCKLMEIVETGKPPGRWCEHCTPGRGCNIYESRPASCRTFECQWLFEPDLPDALRPDRCKVMMTATAGPILNAHCDPAYPLAWRNEPIYRLLKERARTHWGGAAAVVARAGRRVWLINADTDTDLGEVDPRSEVRFEQIPGGGVRATVLPPAPESE
jgi:hypothetical protein